LAATTAARGAMVFQKSNVEIFGLVENMAYFQMPDGTKEYIFGEGFADGAASLLNTDVVARIPLDKTLHTDEPSEASREIFRSLAKLIIEKTTKF
ncbi:MAG: P-loop NTPase, partial [Opitutales bacterium]|nr:P-loop NTPase [Opitutales bacterium]